VTYVNNESKANNLGVIFASNGQKEAYMYYKGPLNIIYNVDSLRPDLEELIYVRYVQDIFDPNEAVKNRIEDLGYKKEKIHDFNGIIVWEYENRH
jgi:hypothetical protein